MAASLGLFLSGCFLSERQLIGEGIRLQGNALAFCLEAGEPCHEAVPERDGYLVLPHPEDASEEEPIFVRFAALQKAGGQEMWLGEAELKDEDQTAWAYVVVRASGETPSGVTEYDVAVPACSEATDSQLIRFGLEKDGVHACTVSNLDAFTEYLTERHAKDFADPDWWDTAQ